MKNSTELGRVLAELRLKINIAVENKLSGHKAPDVSATPAQGKIEIQEQISSGVSRKPKYPEATQNKGQILKIWQAFGKVLRNVFRRCWGIKS